MVPYRASHTTAILGAAGRRRPPSGKLCGRPGWALQVLPEAFWHPQYALLFALHWCIGSDGTRNRPLAIIRSDSLDVETWQTIETLSPHDTRHQPPTPNGTRATRSHHPLWAPKKRRAKRRKALPRPEDIGHDGARKTGGRQSWSRVPPKTGKQDVISVDNRFAPWPCGSKISPTWYCSELISNCNLDVSHPQDKIIGSGSS